MHVAQIAVRFGDARLALVDHARGAYRIGTAPGVDLAIGPGFGLARFPLVEWLVRGDRHACTVRVPVGIPARRADGHAIDGAIVLEPGERITFAIGALAIEVGLVARAAPLARPRMSPRFAGWIAGALIAHLAVLAIADALASPEPAGLPATRLPPALVARILDPPRPPTATSRRSHRSRRSSSNARRARAVHAIAAIEPPRLVEPAPTAPPTARTRRRAVARARRAGILGSEQLDFGAVIGKVDLDQALEDVGPIYDEHDAQKGGFGNHTWDLENDPYYATVKVGRYTTLSRGRSAGDRYTLPGEVGAKHAPRFQLCSQTCTSSDGAPERLRAPIAQHAQALLGCYERNGHDARGEVVIDFAVDRDGRVIPEGEGLGGTGSCVAGVMRRVRFAQREIQAHVVIAFEP